MAIEKKRKRPDAAAAPRPTEPAPKTSLLKADEAFPRGGGSVLTPLEYKEATNEAKRDALFEEGATETTKKSKRRKSAGVEASRSGREGPRIEGLSYKVSAMSTS